MGMQCHFSLNDLPESAKVERLYDKDSDTVLYKIDGDFVVSGTDKPDAWFDIGSSTERQMHMIEFLIRNRVCFTCS